MTDLTQMIRWNANFVRGLAQSVLDRAKVIRTSLTPYTADSAVPVRAAKSARKSPAKKLNVKRATAKNAATKGRKKVTTAKSKRANG